MKRRAIWTTLCAVGCGVAMYTPAAAKASTETVTYDTLITVARGPLADLFPVGAAMDVSYTLDPLIEDVTSDPQTGRFPGATLSLSVSVPFNGTFVLTDDAGRVSVFNNAMDEPSGKLSDQVFVFGAALLSSTLPPEELFTSLEVDFLSDFVLPPAEPTMLHNDSLPFFRLRASSSFVRLETASGFTSVFFSIQRSHSGDGCGIGAPDERLPGVTWLALVSALLFLIFPRNRSTGRAASLLQRRRTPQASDSRS